MLTVHMQLDLNRSTREGLGQFRSTAHMLVPLVEKFPDRVSISLYRTPKLKGIMSGIVPARYNEGWGTWHAKIYAADDEVLLSGCVFLLLLLYIFLLKYDLAQI
jgi:CDP-diacylglycerol---glycerol-3-phosphate 3-phosphatidyltransferase